MCVVTQAWHLIVVAHIVMGVVVGADALGAYEPIQDGTLIEVCQWRIPRPPTDRSKAHGEVFCLMTVEHGEMTKQAHTRWHSISTACLL